MLQNIELLWVLITLIPCYFIFFYKSRSEKLLREFPSPPHHPILGIAPFFLNTERSELVNRMGNWATEYGSILRLWSPVGNSMVIFEAEHAEKLLTSQTNLTKGFDYDYFRPWLGDGLLMSTGTKWAHRRKMLTPAFHFKILEDFMQIFNKEAKKMVSIMSKECTNGVTFDICNYVSLCALDIICETAMGKSVNAQDDRNSEYIQAINEVGRVMQDRAFRPWLRFEPLWKLSGLYKKQQQLLKILHGFTEKVIAERKEEMVQEKSKPEKSAFSKAPKDSENIYFKSKRRLAFLDLLLQVQLEKGEQELTDTDIREETDTFMFEGHDTTSANISFTIYAIGSYPEIQKKVHEELTTIFENDPERETTTEDLTRMKYLECVIKETLRVYPSVPFIQRSLTSDLSLNDGRTIPSGTSVGIFMYQLHRDPKVFPEPTAFRPERFLQGSDGEVLKEPFAYVPFSAGPRNCIGQKFAMMEEKVLLATFFRNFKVKSMIEPKDLLLLSEMILRPQNGLPIQIFKR